MNGGPAAPSRRLKGVRSMAKNGIKIFILLIWLGLMGWWWIDSRTWPAPEKIEAAFLPDYNDYYSLRYQDRKIGWGYKSLRRQPDGRYQFSQGLNLTVLLFEEELEIKSSVLLNLDPALKLDNFTYLVQAGPLSVTEGGEVAGGKLALKVNLGAYGPLLEKALADYGAYLGDYASALDFSRQTVLDPPDGPGLAQAIPSYLGHLGLEVGRNYTFTVLDPAGRRLTPLAVRIEEEGREFEAELGREVPAFKLRLGGDGGLGTEMWVDRFGRVFREAAFGFSLAREDDNAAAARDIEPLVPPAGLARLLADGDIQNLIKKIQTEQSGQGKPPDDQPGQAPQNP